MLSDRNRLECVSPRSRLRMLVADHSSSAAFSPQGGFQQPGLQPQQTGFPGMMQPQMTGFQPPGQVFPQQTGMPQYGQNGYQQRQVRRTISSFEGRQLTLFSQF